MRGISLFITLITCNKKLNDLKRRTIKVYQTALGKLSPKERAINFKGPLKLIARSFGLNFPNKRQ